MNYDRLTTRRAFLSRAATLATCALLPGRMQGGEALRPSTAGSGKPNSVFNGVRIGCITYSYRSMFTSAEETLQGLLQCGLSEVELMGGPIETYAGISSGRPRGKKSGPVVPSARPTAAVREAQLAKCRELRRMYHDAGVNIHLHKIAFGQSD